MSASSGPSILTNGLVFDYDMSNTQKSWRGAPTTNLHPIDGYYTWPTQTLHFWNGNNWVVDSTYTDPGVPGPAGTYLGVVRKYTSGALSSSWSGNSYAYILKTAAMTAGQSYAMSAYTFLSGDCNIDAMYSSIEGASVAALSGGYVTAYDMAQKGSWQRQGLQGTASGNVNFIIAYPQRYGITNGSFTGSILVGGAQVEFGTFPTPYTDTSRSNTQAILDLTNNSTITAASLTYANNNTFSFNGSSNYATIASGSNFTFGTGDFTLEAWYMPSVSYAASNGYIFDMGANGTRLQLYMNNLYFLLQSQVAQVSGPAGVGLNVNTWYHAVGTRVGSTLTLYLNGVSVGTGTSSATLSDAGGTIGEYGGFGPYYFNGQIPIIRVYKNKGLSAGEVQQNFNAQRTRYGI